MTQEEMIYQHLYSGGTITPLEALQKFGCLALSQRIGGLKRMGVPIDSEMVKVGEGKRVKRYWLGKVAYG